MSAMGKANEKVTRTKVNVTERTATNLAANSVLVADTEILLRSACFVAVVYVSTIDGERGRNIPLSSWLLRIQPEEADLKLRVCVW
jgi:hypothetical protein